MSKVSRRSFYPFIFCLVIGSYLSGVPAATQGSTSADGKTSKVNSETDGFKFEVVSIRPVPSNSANSGRFGPTPDGYSAEIRLWYLIKLAYAPEEFPANLNPDGATRISNLPDWSNDKYVIKARVADNDRQAWSNQSSHHELLRSAIREVLKERFKLRIHQQPVEVSGLHLVRTGMTVKLKATPPGFVLPPGSPLSSGGVAVRKGQEQDYYGANMEDLASWLSMTTELPVQDRTGLTGRYEFSIRRIDHPLQGGNDLLDNWPIYQLGLALKPGKVPGIKLIIDHIEKPTEN